MTDPVSSAQFGHRSTAASITQEWADLARLPVEAADDPAESDAAESDAGDAITS